MCGIIGMLCPNARIETSLVQSMRDEMQHRGPDASGLWVSSDQTISFGHRRLSIIDLSIKATQPMVNEDESIVITYNGEIYNHAEIRDELINLGVKNWLTDHSDTEVVLKAYEYWGIECVNKFRGMFAIGINDQTLKKIFLIRDRIGIKPIYYSSYNNKFAFASEIKALLVDKDIERKVDEESFFHYLSFLTVPAPKTLFKNIFKVSPGSYLEVDFSGNYKEVRYWDLLSRNENLSKDKLPSEILSQLEEAVMYRKVSDVPQGVFLSGGIDSSVNAALFSRDLSEPIKTFSIGFDGSYDTYSNELEFAKLAAKNVDANYHEAILSENDLLSFIPKLVWLQDEPIGDPVCMPVYYVSKLAKDNGVTVCQVGEGADELFFGYSQWHTVLKLELLNKLIPFNFIRKIGLTLLRILNKEDSSPFEWLSRSSKGLPVFWGGAEAFTHNEKIKILSPKLKKKYMNHSSWDAISHIWEKFQDDSPDKSKKAWMTYLDLSFRLPELLLMRVDKMSMGVSLEARVPFLDHKFVEFIFGLPARIRAKFNRPKYLLKDSVRGLIPDEIIDRKKQGFGVPVTEWFFSKLGDDFDQELKIFCEKYDYFDYDYIKSFRESKTPSSNLWYIYNFIMWHKLYIDQDEELLKKITE